MRAQVALIALGLVLLGSPALADPVADPEVLFEVPWDGGPLTFQKAGPEHPARGPSALTVGPDGTLWILDDLAHRLVGFGPTGEVIGLVSLPSHHHDLVAAAPDGTFVVYAAHLRSLTRVDTQGQVLDERKLPIHLAAVRALGFAPDGSLEMEDPHGQRFGLGTPDAPRPDKAVLRDRHHGPPGSTSECGLRKRSGKMALLAWPSPVGPTTGREPTVKPQPLDLDGATSAHLVSPCGRGAMLVELELLAPTAPVSVQREVATVSGGKVTGRFRLPANWPYVPSGRFAPDARGAVSIHPLPDRLQVIYWRLP